MSKKAPRKEEGLDLLIRAMATGSSGDAILGQEADGQRSFVNSDTLPTDISPEDHKALEDAGIVFGGVVEGDELFQYVQLPKGWKKSSTGHSMHNNLLDDKGRRRAGIFYKAAFYDRHAHLHCVRRFSLDIDYDKLDEGVAEAIVTDGGTEVFRSAGVLFDIHGDYQIRSAARDKAVKEAKEWLLENYPDWENAAAYWD